MGKAVQSITRPVTRAVGQLNPFNPGSAVGKGIASIPGVSAIQKGATQVFQPLEKAIVQPASAGLASLDKAVGKTIPGGWGTLGTIAASMIPGGQFAALGLSKTAAMTGLGALTGSGVLRPGRGFNLQGAMMGGAMAYGLSNLADYASAAGETTGEASKAALLPQSEYIPSEYLRGTSIGPDAVSAYQTPVTDAVLRAPDMQVSLARPVVEPGIRIPTPGSSTVGIGGYAPPQGILERAGSYVANVPTKVGDFVTNIPSRISEGASSAYDSLANIADKATTGSTYTNFGESYGQNVSNIGSGIKNLITGQANPAAITAATGIKPMTALGAVGYGATGLMALDEQEKYMKEQLAAQQISQQEYDSAIAEINRQRDIASEYVSRYPFNPDPDRTATIGSTLYRRPSERETIYQQRPERLYAYGGSVDSYADGGQPRFLSGGGDGMSDDIPAMIGNKQPARLADGEFVIPADVVSHLGNGSSKAGAKQLYAMMDKVRSARTGTKKQGKQINPRKYMPA